MLRESYIFNRNNTHSVKAILWQSWLGIFCPNDFFFFSGKGNFRRNKVVCRNIKLFFICAFAALFQFSSARAETLWFGSKCLVSSQFRLEPPVSDLFPLFRSLVSSSLGRKPKPKYGDKYSGFHSPENRYHYHDIIFAY